MNDHGHGHDEGHGHGGGSLGIDLWKYRMEIGVLIVVILAMAYLIPIEAERDQAMLAHQSYLPPMAERQPMIDPQPAPTLTPRGVPTPLPRAEAPAERTPEGRDESARRPSFTEPEAAPRAFAPLDTAPSEPRFSDAQLRGAGCLVVGGIGAGLIYVFGPAQVVALVSGGALAPVAGPAASLSPAASAGLFGSVFATGCALGALVTPLIASAAGETNQIATEVAYTIGQLPDALVRSAWLARDGLVHLTHSLMAPFAGAAGDEPGVIVLSQQPASGTVLGRAATP